MNKISITVYCILFCCFMMKGQVVPPNELSLNVAPLIPIDTSNLDDEMMVDPLQSLDDTSSVNVAVLFRLPEGNSDINEVNIQLGTDTINYTLLDADYSLFGDITNEIVREEYKNYFSFTLGIYEYQGGLCVRARFKNSQGDYSTFTSFGD